MPHSSPAARPQKNSLRAHFRAARRALVPHACAQFSARAVAHFLRWLDDLEKPPATMALYLAAPHELNLDALIEPLQARGICIVAPRGDGFAHVSAASTCSVSGAQKWRSADGAAVSVGEIDIVLLPGVAFGRDGSRLGQGGGWYDRALAGSGAILVGVGFARQITQTLPTEAHDISVQWLLCEESMERAGL